MIHTQIQIYIYIYNAMMYLALTVAKETFGTCVGCWEVAACTIVTECNARWMDCDSNLGLVMTGKARCCSSPRKG